MYNENPRGPVQLVGEKKSAKKTSEAWEETRLSACDRKKDEKL